MMNAHEQYINTNLACITSVILNCLRVWCEISLFMLGYNKIVDNQV